MTSITEAVFRGRGRRDASAPSEALRHSAAPLTTQFMARKAIEAVLAGGYTKCESEEPPQQPLPPAPVQPESHGFGRRIMIWVAVFGVAGLLGIATSRLPGHAVQAKQPSPARVDTSPEDLDTPPATAPPPVAVAQLTAPPQAAEPATGLEVPVLRAQLRPLSKQPALTPDTEAAGAAAAGVADDVQSPRQVAASGNGMGAVPLEEVLYEGEPAEGQRAVAPRAAGLASGATPRRTAEGRRSPGQSAGGMNVEGIFWDKVRPMAIIGGNIVEIGSAVGPYKVTAIEQGRVLLSGGGRTLELRP
jgi:hypothetical protein